MASAAAPAAIAESKSNSTEDAGPEQDRQQEANGGAKNFASAEIDAHDDLRSPDGAETGGARLSEPIFTVGAQR